MPQTHFGRWLRSLVGRPTSYWFPGILNRLPGYWGRKATDVSLALFWLLMGRTWYESRRSRISNEVEADKHGMITARQYVPLRDFAPYRNSFNYTAEKITANIKVPAPPELQPQLPIYPEGRLYGEYHDDWEMIEYMDTIDAYMGYSAKESADWLERPRWIHKFEWDAADALLQPEREVYNEAYLDTPRAVDWGGPRQWEYDPELDPVYRIPRALLDFTDERPEYWRQRVWWRGPKGAQEDVDYQELLRDRKASEREDRARRARDPGYDERTPRPHAYASQLHEQPEQPTFEAVSNRALDVHLWLLYPPASVRAAEGAARKAPPQLRPPAAAANTE